MIKQNGGTVEALENELKMVGVLMLGITIFISLLSVSTFGLKSREFGTLYFVGSSVLMVVSISTMFIILVGTLEVHQPLLYILCTLTVNSAFLGSLYWFYRAIEKNFLEPTSSPWLSRAHTVAQGSLVLLACTGSTTPITTTAALYYILLASYIIFLLHQRPLRASRVSRVHLNLFFGMIVLLNAFRFLQLGQQDSAASETTYWLTLIIICLISIAGILIFGFFVFDSQIQLVNDLKNQVQHLADTDPLTGLRTRNYLRSYLNQPFSGGHSRISVLLMDLDHFKKINDTHGHQVGNEVLSCLGQVVRDTLRQSDVAIRYGGEEFLVILTGLAHEDTLVIAERIRSRFQTVAGETFAALGFSPTLTIGGLSEIQDIQHLETHIQQADQNLYQGKRNGKNQVQLTRLQAT